MIEKIKNSWKELKNTKLSFIFVFLVVLSSISMVVSNIIACKNFTFFGWEINGYEIAMPCGVVIFPVTYILSDLFSEVYGYKWSRITCWIAFILNLLVVGIFELAIILPGSSSFTAQEAMETILGSSAGILFAGLIAYVVGDFLNDNVFRFLKSKHGDKKFTLRAVLSSLVGELADSCIFIPCLFLFTGQFGTTITVWYQVVVIILAQAGIKTAYELIISPLTWYISKKLKAYEENLLKVEELKKDVSTDTESN